MISALPVHIIGVNSKNVKVSMASRRCIGTSIKLLHRVQSTYGMARHLRQDVLSTLSRMKVAPCSVDRASSEPDRDELKLSEEFADCALVLEKERFFTGIGDPFDDKSWDSSRWPAASQDNIGEHTDNLMQDSFCRRLLLEGGHVSTDDMWPSCGMELLVGDELAEVPQDFQGWFDDVDLATQQLSPMSQ